VEVFHFTTTDLELRKDFQLSMEKEVAKATANFARANNCVDNWETRVKE
jgi:hypothetical protein